MERNRRYGTASSPRHSHLPDKSMTSTRFLSIQWNFIENLENRTSLNMRESVCCFCWLDFRLIRNKTLFQRVPTILYFHIRRRYSLVKGIFQSSHFAYLKTLVVDKAWLEKRWRVTSVAPLISDFRRSSKKNVVVRHLEGDETPSQSTWGISRSTKISPSVKKAKRKWICHRQHADQQWRWQSELADASFALIF